MKKWFDLKKGLSVVALALATAGMMMYVSTTRAADIDNARGHVNVDLSNFVLVESTSTDESKFGLVSQNDSNSRYLLHYENSFTDRNNLGCTYRSSSKYDLTDVTHIELYTYSQQDSNDKLLFYVNPSSNKYYHRIDDQDLSKDTVSGNGTIQKFSYFYYLAYGTTPQDYKFSINQRYTSEYVYLGLSHEWQRHNAKIYIDNNTINGSGTQGCVNLILKKHNITLLEPEKVTHVVVDENGNSQEKTYDAFTDVKIGLEDGKTCLPGETGDIYRDESVTLTYSLTNAELCDLKSFKFYSDKDKKNLLYEMDVTGKEGKCTFTLTSSLIQTLEDKTGDYKLEHIYLEPVFATKEVTIDFSDQIVEASDEVEVVAVENSDGSREYSLREKGRQGTSGVIGTIYMNQAHQIGDELTVDYKPNDEYEGNYRFRYYEYRICQSSNQVNGSDTHITTYSENNLDIETELTDTYFWIRAHLALKADIELEDKQPITFDNNEVYIDEAVVTWPEGHRKPTGRITYHYYTDEECKEEMESGEYPVNAGIYYVTATLAGDDYYDSVTSNVATITIEKATPVLKELKGSDITYGQSTIQSSLYKDNGEPYNTAYSITGQPIQGKFTWMSENGSIPNAGKATETVLFTPEEGSLWENNYTTAEGIATIKVNKATPSITLQNVTKVYDGQSITSVPATVTGVNGEATGQKVTYEFYRKVNDKYVEMDNSPVNAGTYYVSAYTSSNTNYGYKESEKVEVTIQKRESDLVQVPLGMVNGTNTYRVYITNTVDGQGPTGQINLTVLVGDKVVGSLKEESYLSIQYDQSMKKYYAEYTYGDISSLIGTATEYVVKATYIPTIAIIENYNISDNLLTFSVNDDGSSSTVLTQTVEMVYGGENAIYKVGEILPETVTSISVTWLNLTAVKDSDVVDANIEDNGLTLTIQPENAGRITLAAYVKGNISDSETKSWYIFFDITVSPAKVEVQMDDVSTTYSGNPVVAAPATVTYKKTVNTEQISKDVIDSIPVTYHYYEDQACENEITSPVDVGTYYVKATTEAQRNYQAGESISKLTINPAEPVITIEDKTVTYDGKKHGLNVPVVTGIDGNISEEDVTDAGRVPQGTVKLCYCGNDGCKGECEEPVDAGVYTVTAIYTPGKNDNYAQKSVTATLTIEPAVCTLKLEPMEMVYTGVAAEPNKLTFTGVNGETEDDSNTAGYIYMYSLSTEMNYSDEAPSEAGLYYVYAIRPERGNYERTISNRTTLLIKPADVSIDLKDAKTTYTGDAADMTSLCPATVTNQAGKDITEVVEVTYQYYEDENAMIKIDAPVNAGTYYVQAFVKNHANYNAGESAVQKIIIQKAVPVLSDLKATGIDYGTEIGVSQISGMAAGVKGETLAGTFEWGEPVSHEKRDAGTYALTVEFTPDADAAKNYTEAYEKVDLIVKAVKPKISGADQTEVYSGLPNGLDAVTVSGAKDMAIPAGSITYTYYIDKACTNVVPDSVEGVTDAGTYYCKVDFVSDTNNYTNTSEVYQMTIEKADAVIELQVPTLGKNLESGVVTVKGTLLGVFDDPTGTVTLYKKLSSETDSQYECVATINVTKKLDGDYGFDAAVFVEKGIYDFKAVYNDGTMQNYNVMDGELENVDMSKEPQQIYFEDKLIVKEYGADDFKLSVVDENNGTGKVTYRLIDKVGDSGTITVSGDGTVYIQDTGKAFVIAVKAGDDNYGATYAVAAVQVIKAPSEISLADKTVTYNGQEIAIDEAAITSNGKPVASDENIQIVYTYEHVETGMILDSEPIEAGTYKVSAYSIQNDHYMPSTEIAVANLIIEKAKAEITLETYKVDETNKTLTLQGNLQGVFDYPAGTITLYQKVGGQPDSEYAMTAEDIEIVEHEDGSYGFRVTVGVELDKSYDFKAVYEEGIKQNYIITEGELTQVDIEEVIDEQEEAKTDDDKTDDDKTDDDKNMIVDTGDANFVFAYLLLLIASMIIIVAARKRLRR